MSGVGQQRRQCRMETQGKWCSSRLHTEQHRRDPACGSTWAGYCDVKKYYEKFNHILCQVTIVLALNFITDHFIECYYEKVTVSIIYYANYFRTIQRYKIDDSKTT